MGPILYFSGVDIDRHKVECRCIDIRLLCPLTEHGEADGLGDWAAHPVAGLAGVEPRLVVRYVGHRVHPNTTILKYFL